MGENGNVRAPLAALGAAAGTGYASGRALVTFYAQLGGASWLGIGVAAATFGLLMGLCAWQAKRTASTSFAMLYRRGLPRPMSRLAGALHGLLMAAVAAAMLACAARLGALALPVRRGELWGMGVALALALIVDFGGGRTRSKAGLTVVLLAVALYAGLALDGRPPRLNFSGAVLLRLKGSLPAAILLGLCHAALNACVSADTAIRFSPCAKPLRLGLCCGAGLGLILALGNAAILRGGPALLAQAMPVVLLAARWGLVGFWLCAGFGFLCAVSSLAAALSALYGWIMPGQRC